MYVTSIKVNILTRNQHIFCCIGETNKKSLDSTTYQRYTKYSYSYTRTLQIKTKLLQNSDADSERLL